VDVDVDDAVFMCVPDVSWSDAGLDFDELRVLRAVDGVSSVVLLASSLDMPRDQVRSVLNFLASRGVVSVDEPDAALEGSSGFFRRRGADDDEELEFEFQRVTQVA
jgi:hypothetical protein